MSAEHDKDPVAAAALKRPPRGADGGLDGLGGPVQLGSPDKKKRKSSAQGPSFPPPSEYAPPPNPSADHLIATNPFDDSYNAVSYKLLPPQPPGNPYFANPGSPSFGGYNSFRMPPHLLARVSSPYGATYPLRNQPHPFPHNPVGIVFNRPQAIPFGPHDNAGFGNQPSYNTNVNQNINMPSQHFRPNPGENFGHIPPQNMTQMAHHEMLFNFGPGNNNSPNFNTPQMESSHSYILQPNYNSPKPLQQKQSASKHISVTPRHHLHSTGDNVASGNADMKTVNRNLPTNQESSPCKNIDNLNSAHANGTQSKPRPPRGAAEGNSTEKGSIAPLHPSHVSSEPAYPCGICTHEVNDDQDAILCEASCQKWFHRICTGMTESAYGLLTAEASAVWGCDTCMADKDVQLMRTRETVGPPVLNPDT